MLLIVLLSALPSWAQKRDNYRIFQDRMVILYQEEKECQRNLSTSNSLEYEKKTIKVRLRRIQKEKLRVVRKALAANRNDERFLGVLDYYLKSNLSLGKFEKELRKFTPEVQQSKQCQEFFEYIKYKRLSAPGNYCQDFEVKDHQGRNVRISDVYREHKLTLLDFWASWCRPCRASMSHLKEVYQKYKDRGLEIVSVSLDESKESWDKAYKEDALPWIDCSNLLGWSGNPLAIWYAITAIPHKVLVNSEGVILGVGFDEPGSLEKILDKYLTKIKN